MNIGIYLHHVITINACQYFRIPQFVTVSQTVNIAQEQKFLLIMVGDLYGSIIISLQRHCVDLVHICENIYTLMPPSPRVSLVQEGLVDILIHESQMYPGHTWSTRSACSTTGSLSTWSRTGSTQLNRCLENLIVLVRPGAFLPRT